MLVTNAEQAILSKDLVISLGFYWGTFVDFFSFSFSFLYCLTLFLLGTLLFMVLINNQHFGKRDSEDGRHWHVVHGPQL